jgi:hypothetical protein
LRTLAEFAFLDQCNRRRSALWPHASTFTGDGTRPRPPLAARRGIFVGALAGVAALAVSPVDLGAILRGRASGNRYSRGK